MNQDKNILIDYRWSNKSGIGTMVDNLLPILKLHFNKVYLLSNDDLFFESKKIKVIKIKSKVYSPFEQIEIPLKFPRDVDLCWFPNFNAPFFIFKRKFIHIHDLSIFENEINTLKSLYAYLLIIINIKTSEKVFTVSQFSKEMILKKFKYILSNNKLIVVYNGISNNFLKIKKKRTNSILSVGIVKKRKNFITLIEAFLKLITVDEFKDYKLFIVGQKDGLNDLDKESLKYQSNNIIFTGKVSNKQLLEYYENAKLFIFPTKYEGFGIPLIEAMASKTPVICSNIPVLKEVGKDAPIYFNPNSVDDLKIKIQDLLGNPSKLNQVAIDGLKVAEKYSWKNSANKLINTFSLEG